jgi:hypothetical protein
VAEPRRCSGASDTGTLHGGFSLNGDLSPKWRWSVTGNWDRVESRTLTDTDSGRTDRARSVSNVGSIDALVNGALLPLPAGDISTSIRASGRTSDLQSDSLRGGLFAASDIGRDTGSVQANIDLPIASRNRAVLKGLGNLSLNGNVEVEQLSDFGTLITYGYGVNWSPIEQVRFIASFTEEEGAPSAQQLGNPLLTTPNVRVFDFVRGETVDITPHRRGQPQSDRRQSQRDEARPQPAAAQGHRPHLQCRLQQEHDPQSDRVLPDRDGADRGGVPRPVRARRQRHADPHRQPAGQFPAQRARADPLGPQLLQGDQLAAGAQGPRSSSRRSAPRGRRRARQPPRAARRRRPRHAAPANASRAKVRAASVRADVRAVPAAEAARVAAGGSSSGSSTPSR